MSLYKKAVEFDKLAEKMDRSQRYDISNSLALADKFDKKLRKAAQQKTEADVVDANRARIVQEVAQHLEQNHNEQAGAALAPLWQPSESMHLEELINHLNNVAKILMNGSPADRQFANTKLVADIEGLQQAAKNRPNIPAPEWPAKTQDAPAEKTAPQEKFTPIPANIQTALNTVLVPSGDISPIDVNGQLGPETTKALNVFKRKYNVPGNATPADVYKTISYTAEQEAQTNKR